MGAGSAKGVQAEENEDEVDSFSSTSSDHWEAEVDPPAALAHPAPPKPPKPKPKPPIEPPSTSSVAPIENIDAEKKEKPKKKTTFGFSLRREPNNEKLDEVGNDSSDEEGNKGERDEKGSDKEEKGKDKKGFRLFGWRKDEKKKEKEEGLDEDISDLEKTFDSLGIVGKNKWGGETSRVEDTTLREDVILSPMRKRKNVRGGRGVKGINGLTNGSNGRGSSGSNASKRTFKFSWEKDKQRSPPKDEEDEWEYKAVSVCVCWVLLV